MHLSRFVRACVAVTALVTGLFATSAFSQKVTEDCVDLGCGCGNPPPLVGEVPGPCGCGGKSFDSGCGCGSK
jgi:hypothetical protein